MEIKQENYLAMNIDQISRANFSKICRTCLTMEETLLSENASELFTKLNISFGFEFAQDDILPKAFCTECARKIDIIYDFKKLCTYSEQILKNVVTDEVLKVKEEPDSKTECGGLIEPRSYDSAFDPMDDIKEDTASLTPDNDLNESHSDDDITDNTKTNTVKEEDTDDSLNETSTKKSISIKMTRLFNQHAEVLESDSGYRCNLCHKQSKKRANMRKHMMLHIPKEQRAQYCAICNKRYTRKLSYLKHLKEHEKDDGHKEVNIYQCSECQRLFDNQDELDKHKYRHIPKENRIYECSECHKVFKRPNRLTKHKLVHLAKEQRTQIACTYCDNVYISKESYLKHLQLHENQKGPVTIPKTSCELCGKIVSCLDSHMRNIHRERQHKCLDCNKSFTFRSCLQKHINIVHKKQEVKKCRYLCPKCGKIFGSNVNLQGHISMAHEGQKLYKCEFCNREFTYKSRLRFHVNSSHYNNIKKNFSCHVCGKKFLTRAKVKNHMVVHTGEKPFSCNLCQRRFSHYTALVGHKKKHDIIK